ncbi:MecA-like transpeptidase family protein [Murinocardiopsis flavida]|uniref:MecA-like transpeptidase family protein n=1 Tax=Murinocardiopsis flavida TaxID=645275 RepID=A0A2P8DSC5_9ACTN|nr:penicillin-binding transpeptidase domain-containing protein [Murinocardiopsis flavida]PSL00111.1 MecA-like transpeptidase family protein [Murinocardiopsis flavida]
MDDRSNPERDDRPNRPDSPAPRPPGPAQTGSFASFGDPDGPYVSDSPYGPGSPFPPPRETAADDPSPDDLDYLDDPEDFGPYRIPSGPPAGAQGGPLSGGPSYRSSTQPSTDQAGPGGDEPAAPSRPDSPPHTEDRTAVDGPGGAWNDAPAGASPEATSAAHGGDPFGGEPFGGTGYRQRERPGHDDQWAESAPQERPWSASGDHGESRDLGADRTAAWDDSPAPARPWDRPADAQRAEPPRTDSWDDSAPPARPWETSASYSEGRDLGADRTAAWDEAAPPARPWETSASYGESRDLGADRTAAWDDSPAPARPWDRPADAQRAEPPRADDHWAASARPGDGAPPTDYPDHRAEAASAPYAWDRGEQRDPSGGYGEQRDQPTGYGEQRDRSAGYGEQQQEHAWGHAADSGERRDRTGGYGEAWSGAPSESPDWDRSDHYTGQPSAAAAGPGDPWSAERAPYGAAPGGGHPPRRTEAAAHGAGAPPTTPPEGFAAPAGPHEPRRRSRKPLVFGIIGTFLVLALIGGGISWYLLTMPVPEKAAQSYADAWASGEYAAVADLATGSGVEKAYKQVDDNLGVEKTTVTLGDTAETDSGASTPYTVKQKLSNAGTWSYKGELPLKRVEGGEWKVDFTPAAIHPELGDGKTLDRANKWGKRGAILAADGSRLDTDDATGSVKMLTGQMGKAGKKDLKKLGPAYREGDPTGKTGIQKSQEEQLAGTATTVIQAVAADGGKGKPSEVGAIKGSNGKDVQTAIDPAVQKAAAGAIVNESKPTALVAVRPSSGEVLAAANVPGGYNRALEGRYPAGSTFKIISYEALFASGMGMGDAMSCPKGTKVDGWPFKNAGDAAYGKQSVTEAFATSCNTALVQKVDELLDADGFMKAATTFGVNSDLKPGLPVFDPTLPKPDSTTLLAATSLGQGKLQTTPLHMASVAAAVADGTWRSPVVVTSPEVSGQPEATKVKGAENLRGMMRSVVTDGTAKDVGFGAGVHGKSGTAEYGAAEDGKDPPAHGWFVGYRDDVAFAVLVEDGESGSKAAAPLAKKFLDGMG